VSKRLPKDKQRREDAVRQARHSFNDLKEVLERSGRKDLMALDEQARSYDAVAYKAYQAAREEAEAAQRALDVMMQDAEGAFGRLAVR